MTNSLSEQVAELEAKQHHLWDVKEAIRVENFELWSKNERLEAERDELTRENTLASWKIENLKFEHDKVAGERNDLRAERDEWKQDAEISAAEAEAAYVERDDLQRQVQEARDERDALRAGQGRRLGETIASEDAPFKGMSDLRYKEPALPRVISAEELRAGMVVAWKVNNHHWGAGEVYDDGADALSEIRGITHIVLLEDAPQPTGYADDDHQDAEITDWHQPTPRLTVHDLEVAPEGSELYHHEKRASRVKQSSFWWLTRKEEWGRPPELETTLYAPLTSTAVIATGLWADATLTAPEDA